MITADRDTLLGMICEDVESMKPGQRYKVSRFDLAEIPSFIHKDALFAPADRVLGNIMGSADTHSYTVDPMTGDVTFIRHEKTGNRYYSDPDHRQNRTKPKRES